MNRISFTNRKRIRKSFGRIPEDTPMPNLIDVQRASYDAFLQMNVSPDARTVSGLQEVFKSVFPIDDFAGRGRLEFVYYELEEPKYDVEECIQRGMTYAAPLKVVLRLIVWDLDEDTGARSIRDIKEQPVYMGDLPLMTDNGTFVVNGTERVIVSQMHRSPGVFFDHDKGKTHASGKYLFAARVIPYRGSWLDFEFDAKDLVYVRIDRKRKLPVTTLLYALENRATEALRAARKAKGETLEISEIKGMDAEEILGTFYGQVPFSRTRDAAGEIAWARPFEPDNFRGAKLVEDLVDADTGAVVAKAEEKLTARAARRIAETTKQVLVSRADLVGRFVAEDMFDPNTGEIFADAGEEIGEAKLAAFEAAGLETIPTLAIDQSKGPWIRNTLAVDKNANRDDALIDIYRVIRPGEPPTSETAEALFRGLFFDTERYDLSAVGRVKMNMRLGIECDDTVRVLRKEDILRTVQIMCELKDGRGQIDDIDNLGNRRVRSVGELMENQYRIGLLRMERAIRERMGSVDIDGVMPHDLINAKPAAAAVREFFGSSQLSQFMDQTNPLSEVTHKRRLSALGPGGLTRERAGFEVRDVHPTHYGRICPIETPEGPNIGLINSLATYARVNKYGFIESPYRRVNNKHLTDEVVYLSAMEEAKFTIAQANATVDGRLRLTDELVSCRKGGNFVMTTPDQVQFIDVSPKQLVSVAAALVPFLENDDANRALMGSNMQRQAVPLIQTDAPLVGTGMEDVVARDSGAVVIANRT
ncbi:MAG TPA: DNA-directed RNA polymerase subunit beta, partial [Acidiphilium sp.]